MDSPLQPGNVAVITGGASGIGLACARSCALRHSMQVVLVDRDEEALDAVAEDLSGQSLETVLSCACDVADPAAWSEVRERVWGELGGCHFLFLNAGIGGGGGPLKHADRWKDLFEVNLFGVLHGIQAFVPGMIRQGTPAVVATTSSRAGITTPAGGDAAYNASKAAVRVLAESLEHQLRNTPRCMVSSRLLLPGMTRTQISRNAARRIKGEAYAREAAGGAPEGTAAGVAPEKVVALLLHSVHTGGPFYVIGEDGEMDTEHFAEAVRWSAEDIAQQRPPLSRWLEPYRSKYLAKL